MLQPLFRDICKSGCRCQFAFQKLLEPHTRQRNCDVTMIGEDGQRRLCGTVSKNAQAMSNHKRIHQKRKFPDVDQDDDLSP
ncbi:hypothetical protein [Endozoicomonas sp. ISHI1]|nr:hypothetical protein [Endozoicomonas sp. ISHI1]